MQGKKTAASKAKSKAATAKPASGANVLHIAEDRSKSRERLLAEVGFSPCGASANTARTFAADFAGDLHITDAIDVLRAKATRVQQGDMTDVEATLTAQGQCRATLETLAEIKSPKAATFVRQQNVAYQQQVNNGSNADGNLETNTRTHARTEENHFQKSKLLADQSHERTHLDTGATTTAGGSDPALEALAALNRAKKSSR